jgi:hypothetical protein
MVSVASLFAQVLSLISRRDFDRAVRVRQAEKAAKGFSCWDQFVAMLFCQLGGAHSLREICGGLATAMGKLRHLGLSQAPSRSTLSYANSHRPWELFEDVFHSLLGQTQAIAGRHKRKFRFKNPLRSIDASTIHLCREVFDRARYGRTKGAVKLHLMLDHQGCLPGWACITEGKVHDVTPIKALQFGAGTIVADIQGAVADQTVLQGSEAEPEGQDVRGDQRERGDRTARRHRALAKLGLTVGSHGGRRAGAGRRPRPQAA